MSENIEDEIGYDPYGVSDEDINEAKNDVKTVSTLAEEIADIISDAKPILMSSDMIKINKNTILTRIDLLRRGLPDQLARADQINQTAEKNLLEAKEKAGEIIKNATNRAEYLASNENVVSRAKQKADQIIEEAKQEAKKLSAKADLYCVKQFDNLLNEIDIITSQTNAGRAKLALKLDNARNLGLLDESEEDAEE